MVDPNPTVQGRGIAYLLHHGIELDWFDPDLQEAIRKENEEFIDYFENLERKPAVLEESSLLLDRVPRPTELDYPSDEEIRLVGQANLADLSESALSNFVGFLESPHSVPSNELWEHLRKALFLKSRAEDKQLAPTVAGLVLFGRKPDTFIPQCKVKADSYFGGAAEGASVETTEEEKVISGPLGQVVADVEAFFRKHVQKVPRIEGSERVSGEEYPWLALREAVVNALGHRDYRMGGNVYFQMFRDRVVVRSPGLPLRPNTLERFRQFAVNAHPRNPLIADTVASLMLMELKGKGVRAMRQRLRDYGLPDPRFDFDGLYFVVTVFGRERATIRMRLSREILKGLSSRQVEMLEAVRKQGRITSKACENMFRISRQAANKDFTYLMRLGLLDRKGSGRATYYVLADF